RMSLGAGSGPAELARWQLTPGHYQPCASPPFRLPAGLHELTIASRSWHSGPTRVHSTVEAGDENDSPYSLRVARVSLYPIPRPEAEPEPASITARHRPEASRSRAEIETR